MKERSLLGIPLFGGTCKDYSGARLFLTYGPDLHKILFLRWMGCGFTLKTVPLFRASIDPPICT
jgi:hypothetical protein